MHRLKDLGKIILVFIYHVDGQIVCGYPVHLVLFIGHLLEGQIFYLFFMLDTKSDPGIAEDTEGILLFLYVSLFREYRQIYFLINCININ